MRNIRSFRVIILSSIVVMLMNACVYGPPVNHHRPAYYYPYGYYYYPSVSVYFHYSTGFYFYLSDGIWIRTRVLPPYIRLSQNDRIHLNIESDKPYLFHKQHTERFNPRPAYKPQPQIDKTERKSLQKWYKEQEEYKKQKLYKDDDKRRKQR